MTTTLIDTCIILDILDRNSTWHQWSKERFKRLSETSTLVINPIIFSELCAGMDSAEEVLSLMHSLALSEAPLSHETLFLASKAYLIYRKNGGVKTGVLPDFYIGAQAAVHQWSLLSRDKGRYTSYFPSVDVILPSSH